MQLRAGQGQPLASAGDQRNCMHGVVPETAGELQDSWPRRRTCATSTHSLAFSTTGVENWAILEASCGAGDAL